jgi:NAD(P)-dependent dehydrogenase (short-subunit alcohol dehydrogenase family)
VTALPAHRIDAKDLRAKLKNSRAYVDQISMALPRRPDLLLMLGVEGQRIAGGALATAGPKTAAKAGAEALLKCWADEIESMPIRVSIVDPGRRRTAMRSQAFPGEDPETVVHPSVIGPLIVELARGNREPPLEISFREWSQGPGVAALI